MVELSPAYLSALAQQIGGIAAFLGGFAATYLATLLTLTKPGRVASTTIGLAAVAAVSFIVVVAAATSIVAAAHPEAPPLIAGQGMNGLRALMSLPFALGISSLLASIGVSGWLRSRGTGLTTSIAAASGFAVTFGLMVTGG